MQYVAELVLYFTFFSVCGWICESIFCSINEKKLVNRGFLSGPVCPVYGFGGLIVVYLLAPLRGSILLLFVCGMVCTTVLEYATSWVLEKLFDTTWWDYSDLKYNIDGRVCLQFSVIFGLLSVVAVELLYPPAHFLMGRIPPGVKPWAAGALLFIYIGDCAATVGSILSMNGKLAELHRISLEMKHRAEAAYHTKLSPGEWREKLRMDKSQWSPSLKESLEELWAKWDERKELLARRRQVRRLRGAFPNMKHRKHQEQLHEVKAAWEELKERGKKKKASNGKKDEKKC